MKLIKIMLCLFVVIIACSNPTETQEDPRIVWGQSIAGIKLGDDSLTVIKKLGKPTYSQEADIDGSLLIYGEGSKYNYMEILVVKSGAPHLGVNVIGVYSPYNGKTKDGIGIGVTRNKSLEILGQPNRSETEQGGVGNIIDIYLFDRTGFSLEYRSGVVYRVSMFGPVIY